MSAPLTLLAVSLITLSASSAAAAATDVDAQDVTVRYPSYARVVHTKPIVRKHYERVPVRRCHTVRPATRRYGHEPFEHCRTTHESRVVEEVKGYRVTYRYAGETFEKVMPHDPGDRIYVNVRIVPLDAARHARLTPDT